MPGKSVFPKFCQVLRLCCPLDSSAFTYTACRCGHQGGRRRAGAFSGLSRVCGEPPESLGPVHVGAFQVPRNSRELFQSRGGQLTPQLFFLSLLFMRVPLSTVQAAGILDGSCLCLRLLSLILFPERASRWVFHEPWGQIMMLFWQ